MLRYTRGGNMISKIYIDKKLVDKTQPEKIIKQKLNDGTGRYSIYVSIPTACKILICSENRTSWCTTLGTHLDFLFFIYNKRGVRDTLSLAIDASMDNFTIVSNSPVYISIYNKDTIAITTVNLQKEYDCIFDEMDIVDEEVIDSETE